MSANTTLRALVRRPSPRIADGEVTHINRSRVDFEHASAQHTAYLGLLEARGYDLVFLPELPEHPDGVFVEDVLVAMGDTLVVTRPGAASRRGEVASAAACARSLGRIVRCIEAPGTLDGGDVLQLARHVLVGCGARSDAHGCAQLAASVHSTGRTLVECAVTNALHLKSAVTALPDGTLIAAPQHVDTRFLESLGYAVLCAEEASAADVLCLGHTVVLPADAPHTFAMLRARGFDVVMVDISEFQKVEAGVTCMSVLF